MTIPHLMNCPHMADGWCLACVKEQDAELRRLTAENELLRDALATYGRHELDCLLRRWEASEPRADGYYHKYAGTWYRYDNMPPCTCGLSNALAGGKE